MSKRRRLFWLFAILALTTLGLGGWAIARQSDWVIVLALTPFFAIIALALGLGGSQAQDP